MDGSGAGMPASIEYVVVLLMVGVGKISLKNAFLAVGKDANHGIEPVAFAVKRKVIITLQGSALGP
eukprot:scaffold4071_cov136-Skeletonema_marinoi.AAC.9